jgi:glycosyltransferase involved in cell wall biosynthesis
VRIVYLHQHYRTPAENGGVRSFHFARALAARGHEVHVVTARNGASSPAAATLFLHDDAAPGVVVHFLDVPYDNAMGFSRRLRAFADFAVRSAGLARRLRGDVVIATSTPLTIALPALWAIFARRSRFVFEVRDAWPDVPIALGALSNPVLRVAARLLERAAHRRASTVIALSEGMAEAARRAGAEPERVAVIPNIADTEAFAPERAEASRWLADHPELQGRRLAVYCGTVGFVNGIGALVDLAAASWAQGSDLTFVVIGEGRERADVTEAARRAGVLEVNFFVLAGVPKRTLPDILAAADIAFSFVIDVPELEQNSANKFFDTLASGTPLAINHGGWQQEVLERSGAGLRLSRDPAVAADQLNSYLDDEQRLRSAGAAAARLASTDYSLETLARRFCDIVERDGALAGAS